METLFLLIDYLKGLRSYPTYEEWKLARNKLKKYFFYGSYPTYEEWKLLAFFCFSSFLALLVLILPMRNGNQ